VRADEKADCVYGTESGNSLPKLGARAESRQEPHNYQPLAVHPLSGLRRIKLKFNILRYNSANCPKELLSIPNSPRNMLHKFFQVGKIFQNSGRRISEKNDERKKNETMDNAVRHMPLG
jgi:hypothetical protein